MEGDEGIPVPKSLWVLEKKHQNVYQPSKTELMFKRVGGHHCECKEEQRN